MYSSASPGSEGSLDPRRPSPTLSFMVAEHISATTAVRRASASEGSKEMWTERDWTESLLGPTSLHEVLLARHGPVPDRSLRPRSRPHATARSSRRCRPPPVRRRDEGMPQQAQENPTQRATGRIVPIQHPIIVRKMPLLAHADHPQSRGAVRRPGARAAPTSRTLVDSQTRIPKAGAKGRNTVIISTGRESIGSTFVES